MFSYNLQKINTIGSFHKNGGLFWFAVALYHGDSLVN